jgi:hypothetical protein
MKSPKGKAKIIKDAKCTRFSLPNRHMQPIIILWNDEKLKKFTSMDIGSWFSSQKNESLINQLSLR